MTEWHSDYVLRLGLWRSEVLIKQYLVHIYTQALIYIVMSWWMDKLKGHEWGFSCSPNPVSSCMNMIKDLPVCYPNLNIVHGHNLKCSFSPNSDFHCVCGRDCGFSCLKNPDLNFLHGYDWGFSCLPNPPEAVFQNNGIQFMGITHMFPDSA